MKLQRGNMLAKDMKKTKQERCPLYKVCKSSGKKKSGWVCTKGDDKTRKQSCAVYVGFYTGKDMRAVLDLEQKDVSVKPL